MRVHVRNVLGVVDAALDVSKVALIAGGNYQGKSSLLEAIAAVAVGSKEIRGLSTKTQLKEAVHAGADRGSAVLAEGEASRKVVWPDGEVEERGRLPFLGSPLGIGQVAFSSLAPKEAMRELAARLDAQPTLDDVKAALSWGAFADVAKVAEALHREGIDPEKGWDYLLKQAEERGLERKREWEKLTGAGKWGAEKAPRWHPPEIDPDQTYSIEALDRAVGHAEEALVAVKARGQADAMRVAEWKALADTLPAIEADVGRLRGENERAMQALSAAQKERAALPDHTVSTSIQPCPHCAQPVNIRYDQQQKGYVLDDPKNLGALDEAAIRKVRLRSAELDGQISRFTSEAKEADRRVIARELDLDAARKAKKKLDEAGDRAEEGATPDAVREAEEALGAAKRRLAAYKVWMESQRLCAMIRNNTIVQQALGPGGVRKVATERAVAAFNGDMAKLCGQAKAPVVSIDESGMLFVSGRPFPLLSESERWRADALIRVALAVREGAGVMVFPSFHLLEPAARPGFVLLLGALGIPAVVEMTAKDQGTLPKLAAHGLGQCYWMEGGVLSPVDPT